jgi:glycosyltransferase involved in cell wall biosynthesis
MRILFVQPTMGLGGIETQILKLSHELADRGHDVTLLTTGAGSPALLAAVAEKARIVRHAAHPPVLPPRPAGMEEPDIIYSCGSFALLLALHVRARWAPRARVVTGTYFGREYFFPPTHRGFFPNVVRDVLAELPDSNVVFATEGCRASHAAGIGRSFRDSPIVPVAGRRAVPEAAGRPVQPRRVVSVGRIVDFKTYNFTMLDVLERLAAEGIVLDYEIYGDGDQLERLRAEVERRGLGGRVRLHGQLPYERFTEAVRDAFAFVGHGTAALEAAALGVPATIAIESAPGPASLGFFGERAGFNVGEAGTVADDPSNFADDLRRLARMSREEYDALALRGQRKANETSVERVVDGLLAAFEASAHVTVPVSSATVVRAWATRVRWGLGRVLRLPGLRASRYAVASPSGGAPQVSAS